MSDNNTPAEPVPEELSIIVMSQNMDKALGSFIIATGASLMDVKVTMFFAFWGMNVVRREEHVSVKKDFMGKMFGWMMPRGADKLKLSNTNMMGMGTNMMKGIMKKKNVMSLSQLIENAQADENITMVACDMSMDMMGIKKEELIDGIEIGGVATFIAAATSEGSKGTISFT